MQNKKIIIVLLICILVMSGFIIYDKFIKEDVEIKKMEQEDSLIEAKKEILLFINNIENNFDGSWFFDNVNSTTGEIIETSLLNNEFKEEYVLKSLNDSIDYIVCEDDPIDLYGSTIFMVVKTKDFQQVYEQMWKEKSLLKKAIDEEKLICDSKEYDKDKYTLFGVYVGEHIIAPYMYVRSIENDGNDKYSVDLDIIDNSEKYYKAKIRFEYNEDGISINEFVLE